MSWENRSLSLGRSRRGVGRVKFVFILAGLFVAVLVSVNVFLSLSGHRRGHPPEAQWYQEVSRLYGAMESFREKFGQCPPNFDDMDRVAAFVEKAFPQYEAGTSTPYPEGLDAARALVFWLDEISTDPADPFAAKAAERFKFFEFPAARVRGGRFYQTGDEDAQPYVYFAHTSYDTVEYRGLRPYVRSEQGGVKEYFAPETAQIIAAGRDNQFGHGGLITNPCEADRDNIVAFHTRRVGDIDPTE